MLNAFFPSTEERAAPMVWERRAELGKVDLSNSELPIASYPGEETEEREQTEEGRGTEERMGRGRKGKEKGEGK